MGVSVKNVTFFSWMIFFCAGDRMAQKNVFVCRIVGVCKSI